MTTKLIFSAVVTDSHIELLYKGFKLQKDRANNAKEAFLRHIMHEVRVPLNSITMGLDVLATMQDSGTSSGVDREALMESRNAIALMREASSFMGGTLTSGIYTIYIILYNIIHII